MNTRLVSYRHNGMANVAFGDGHTKSMKPGALEDQAAGEEGTTLSGAWAWTFLNFQ